MSFRRLRRAYQSAAVGNTDAMSSSSQVGMKVPEVTVLGGIVKFDCDAVLEVGLVGPVADAGVGVDALGVDWLPLAGGAAVVKADVLVAGAPAGV